MVTQNLQNCTGCGVCAAICPRKCIEIKLNKEGFYVPQIADMLLCVNCGLCDQVCPKDTVHEDKKILQILSAVILDNELLAGVSSGGVCYELAKQGLLDKEKVCACVYDYAQHRAIHSVITDASGLKETKGSKYIQSYTADAFSQIFDGQKWVVFGTPCQIAAIAKAAERKKMRDNFLLVDFFCHGTPSMHLWDRYVNEHGGDKISKIDFRSKEFGWGSFSFRFTYEDGTQATDYRDNMFYNFFFNNLCLNAACYQCRFKSLKSMADIRVGDYWGDKYKHNKEGVSCCVVFTEQGREAIEKINSSVRIQQEKAEDVLQAQMTHSPAMHAKVRKKLLRAFQGKRTLKTIFNTTLLPYRVRCKLLSILRR